MKRSSYGERDYAFGQTMLALRTSLGLTQAGMAEHLGVSRRAVGEWEAGSSYPKAEHLKAFPLMPSDRDWSGPSARLPPAASSPWLVE
jgi:hypothetical protein